MAKVAQTVTKLENAYKLDTGKSPFVEFGEPDYTQHFHDWFEDECTSVAIDMKYDVIAEELGWDGKDQMMLNEDNIEPTLKKAIDMLCNLSELPKLFETGK